ncbi:MATE family efflux transporter [Actinomadura sp. 1N219]|uniref:MATE family efflux transporter n=1 Tax=Actinomadura sp. 1N219 TaxID=3375152 RepID=UPI0037B15D5B
MSEHWRRIGRLAVPMAAAQTLAVMVPVVIVAMMGWMGTEAIQVRALYMPLAFLFFAVQIAFDIASQTISALRSGRGEPDAMATMLSLALVWAVAGLVLAGGLIVAAPALANVLGAAPEIADDFVTFLRWMSIANLTLAWPVLCTSTLRGMGRAGTGATIMITGIAVEIAGLSVLGFGLDLGISALPLATALNGVVAGAFGMVMLGRAGLLQGRGWRPEVLGVLLRTGIPVSLTNLVMFGLNFVFVMMLKPFGPNVIAGFGTAVTLQNLIIMPAVVLGSATAIVMNQRRGADERIPLLPVLRAALWMSLAVYLVIVPAVWLLRGVIGGLTAENEQIAGETAHYIAIVGPSYLVLCLVLTSLVALEQIGGALLALTGTAIYVLGSVGIAAVAGRGADDPAPVYGAMSGMNAAGVVAVVAALVFVRLRDYRMRASPKHRRRRAPPIRDGKTRSVTG